MTITDRILGVYAVAQAASKRRYTLKRTKTREEALRDQDPVLAFLAQVPIDDEPVTAADERAIAEGWAAYHRGEAESATDAK